MRSSRAFAGVTGAVVVVASALAATGCGGKQQDADEPSGNFKVDVVKATFPTAQRLSKPEELYITVRNADTKTVPNIAVTVDSFDTNSRQPGLADPSRPVWILDEGPKGGITAYVHTWALGKLAPGQTRTFEWHVTPILAGKWTVKYRVAAGLNGKAVARLADGGVPEGRFAVNIAKTPPAARVDPKTGAVVRGSK